MISVIVGIALVIGALFALSASLGLIRFKDVYMRMHAASKAGTLGSGLLLLALALHAGELGVVTRAIAGVSFFLLTAPVSAHLLARAAYIVGYKPCDMTVHDALAEAQDGKKQ
ncbi:monovalent cation/H(+) antiporter subunit G [Breoghania sp.]|uniref:monovalent cation/H(+) antiporter subunit G n=1 Tax=Breoghania sp. TaxID=2065378 RepID=UPI002AA8179D|nr:monovalent cation/H(+) antiporter subunit G [Breoghania sp.]